MAVDKCLPPMVKEQVDFCLLPDDIW